MLPDKRRVDVRINLSTFFPLTSYIFLRFCSRAFKEKKLFPASKRSTDVLRLFKHLIGTGGGFSTYGMFVAGECRFQSLGESRLHERRCGLLLMLSVACERRLVFQ